MATKVEQSAIVTGASATVKPSVRMAEAYAFQWGDAKHSKDGAKLSIPSDAVMGSINLNEKTCGKALVAGLDCADIEKLLRTDFAQRKFIVRRSKKFAQHGSKATAVRESVAMTGAEILEEIGIEGAFTQSAQK